MSKYRVVVVEDESALARLVQVHLQNEGYEVATCANGALALALLKKEDRIPHLMILDVMMPGMDGFELLRQLKRNHLTKNIPIIMLTARGSEEDRINGLESGADDYVTKPFSPRELMLRVKRLLNMVDVPQKTEKLEPIVFGHLVLDEARFRTTVNDELIDISATEMKLLVEMIRLRGKALTRRRILELAWGDMPNVTDRTIDTHVKRLRKKLGEAAIYLETVRGIGYRWTESPNND